MAYDLALADRIRRILTGRAGVSEKKMFGGLAFLVNGNMICGPAKDRLMLRLGNEGAAEAMAHPHITEMDFTGKPIRSMVYLTPEGWDADEALESWVDKAYWFASSLPPK